MVSVSVAEKKQWWNWLGQRPTLCDIAGLPGIQVGEERLALISLPDSLLEALIKHQWCPGDLRRAAAVEAYDRMMSRSRGE